MAIAKIEKRTQTVWSGPARLYTGGAAALGLVSLLLLWGAFTRYMVRTNYAAAVFKHDSNRRPDVRSLAEKAMAWGSHAESKELLAKALVDANQLDAAEKLYREIEAGPRKARGACGLGVILLRRADAEKDMKKALDLVSKAKESFTEAKGADSSLVEAQIGAATGDLLGGLRAGNATRVASARAELSKILKALQGSEEAAARVSREGYIDLFVGLARANASPVKFSKEALEYSGAARRYLPNSMGLYGMELALQAQQMQEAPPPVDRIKAIELPVRLKKLREKFVSSPKGMEDVIDSWFALTLATAAALGRGGDLTGSKDMMAMALSAPKLQDALLAPVLEASLALETARAPESNWNRRMTNYSQAYSLFFKLNARPELQDPSRAMLRASTLNNQAYFEEDSAALGGGDKRYEDAVNLLKKALEVEQQAGLPDGSYEVRRNLAVIQKRREKPEAADHFAAAQRSAAARPEEWVRKDLEELQKYFAGSP